MRCCLSYKDTILKANHNYILRRILSTVDVVYPTKILFWKRITTQGSSSSIHREMLFILQRYYFESESQQYSLSYVCFHGCCLSYKDTILKANHNVLFFLSLQNSDVVYPTKILFWKRITTCQIVQPAQVLMLFILQRYYFESESQQNGYGISVLFDVVYPTKILFWKRITTNAVACNKCCKMLFILQRYYFESESQLLACMMEYYTDVVYPTKILFWKRITTNIQW